MMICSDVVSNEGRGDLILASSSRYRQKQLEQLGLAFQAINPEVNEQCSSNETAVNFALRMAACKAKAVAVNHPNDWVIGADQVCEFEGSIIRKPGNHQNAVRQLTTFSGKKVIFHSALSVQCENIGKQINSNSMTTVHFKSLSAELIEDYLHNDKPYDCAGAFKIESQGLRLMQSVESQDPSALVGLPLIALCSALKQLQYPGL